MTLISSFSPAAMSVAFWRSIKAALARSSRSLRQRQLGLFGPVRLKFVEPAHRPAHFLAVGDAARGRGADLDQRLLHFQDDHADHLRGIFRAVENLGDVGRENVPWCGKRYSFSHSAFEFRALYCSNTYTRSVPVSANPRGNDANMAILPLKSQPKILAKSWDYATNSRSHF